MSVWFEITLSVLLASIAALLGALLWQQIMASRAALLDSARTPDTQFRERLTNRLTEMLNPLGGFQEDLNGLVAVAEHLSASVAALQTHVSDLTANVAQLEAAVTSIQAHVTKVTATVADLEATAHQQPCQACPLRREAQT